MCGICGFTGNTNEKLINDMCDILSHRGPDDRGIFIDHNEKINLGHRRLSIIDLDTGHQPMFNEDGSICIIYNGEIYNYKELRNNLIKTGHIFKTNSDTEVLLHLYEENKERMFDYINGIFSFAIYDKRNKIILLARDHFGVKPLHYSIIDGELIFASEIKSILLHPMVKREINFEALHYFINLKYIPGNLTLFKGIFRMQPGEYGIYDIDKREIKKEKYFNLDVEPNYKMREEEAIEGINYYLMNAVKRQIVSDVPIGVYLSGGMDSSAITAMMSKLNAETRTFSMGFNEPTDEVDDARMVAEYFNTEHKEIFITPEPFKYLPKVIWHTEEPKVNNFQGYFLSKFVSQNVKVVLGGLGGDELFAGYTNNRFLYPLESLHNIIPAGNLISRIIERYTNSVFLTLDLRYDIVRRGLQLAAAYGDKTKFYLILRNVWDFEDKYNKIIYSEQYRTLNIKTRNNFDEYFKEKNKSIVEQSLLTEIQTKLPDDFLLNEDRTSMANGLEVRVPFLDIGLVKFSMTIPYHLKIKGNQTKYIFKKAMEDILPARVMTKKKWGFAINPYYQFKKDLKAVSERVLTKDRIEKQGIFNYDFIKNIINHSPSKLLRWHYFYLWMLVGFSVWKEMYIDNNNIEKIENIEQFYG